MRSPCADHTACLHAMLRARCSSIRIPPGLSPYSEFTLIFVPGFTPIRMKTGRIRDPASHRFHARIAVIAGTSYAAR